MRQRYLIRPDHAGYPGVCDPGLRAAAGLMSRVGWDGAAGAALVLSVNPPELSFCPAAAAASVLTAPWHRLSGAAPHALGPPGAGCFATGRNARATLSWSAPCPRGERSAPLSRTDSPLLSCRGSEAQALGTFNLLENTYI